ncbi:MAG: phosphate butyryltransferase [Prevotella sp.]|nr:phosphate butyryltransferase [Prevotella sp.]
MQTFQQLDNQLRSCGTRRRIAAVCVYDDATREALRQAEEVADAVYVDADTPEAAAAKAVALIRNGEADVLMKGLIGTDQLLRAVLNKETGLMPTQASPVLTHLAAAEIPGHDKLLFFTDAAVIPYPTHEQRIAQVRYAVNTLHALGIDEPRIALIHCAEHGGKAFPFVDGYADIKRMAAEGAFGACRVDGPLDVKTACSPQALAAKHLTSPLEGQADVLVFPDIEAGNAFYKTLTLFTRTRTAGMLCGAQAPVVVPSRGDSVESKLNSIRFALACIA